MDTEKYIKTKAKSIGQAIKESAFNQGAIELKGIDDPVTKLDKMAESVFREDVAKKIDAGFLGEEFGIEGLDKKILFYIDPIDGTKSFINKEFESSFSVAMKENNEFTLGIVYDFMRDIMYVANKDSAYLEHGKKTFQLPLKTHEFSRPLVYVGRNILPAFENYDKASIRPQQGSVALSMVRLTTSYAVLLMPPYDKKDLVNYCDIAAGVHIINKSGYKIYNLDKSEFLYKDLSRGLLAYREGKENLVEDLLKHYTQNLKN